MKTIKLTKGKFAIVDDDLFDELNQYRWFAKRGDKTWYAARNIRLPDGRRTTCHLHREVFRVRGEPVPREVDHKDRDGLNNQSDNLRPATRSQQNRNKGRRSDNTSGFIGVSWTGRKWQAQVRVNGKRKRLGYFTDPFSAAWVRDQFVKQLDPHAQLNDLVDRRAVRRAA
jgi:hypothetical protein